MLTRRLKVCRAQMIPANLMQFTNGCIAEAPTPVLIAIGEFLLSITGCGTSEALAVIKDSAWMIVMRIAESGAAFDTIDLLFSLYSYFPFPMDEEPSRLVRSAFETAVLTR
jgi:hypothetical protein